MTNVLYFEIAGGDFNEEQKKHSDVGYYRIRTSFLNGEGEQIFLDLGNTNRRNPKGKLSGEMGIWVDFCFKAPANGEEIKYHEIYSRTKEHLALAAIDYTKENIVKWINEKLDCNFDTMEVLDSFYGYCPFGNTHNTYNLMENIELDHERAAKRKTAYEKVDLEYRTTLNAKYSIIGMLEMKDKTIVIRTHVSDKQLDASGLPRILEVSI